MGGRIMLPFAMDDSERNDLFIRLRDDSILCSDACDLLVDKLLSASDRRSCLSDKEVRNHDFFLNALGCLDLKRHLLSDFTSSLSVELNRNRSRSSSHASSSKSFTVDDSKRIPLLTEQS